MPATDREPDRLTVPRQQAADAVGLSLRTLERLERDGQGPPRVLIRGRVFYRLADLERWIASLSNDVERPS